MRRNRRGRGAKRRGPLPPVVIPSDILRKIEGSARKARRYMDEYDRQAPETRARWAFFGNGGRGSEAEFDALMRSGQTPQTEQPDPAAVWQSVLKGEWT